MRPLESANVRKLLVALSWLIPAAVVIVGHVVDMVPLLQLGGLLLVGRAVHFYRELDSQ